MLNQTEQETKNGSPKINTMQQYRQIERLIQVAFMTSKGSLNRIRLMELLKKEPLNTHQLSVRLGINYKAAQHHISFLKRNNLVSRIGTKYGAVFFPSTLLKEHMTVFDNISQEILGG